MFYAEGSEVEDEIAGEHACEEDSVEQMAWQHELSEAEEEPHEANLNCLLYRVLACGVLV